MFVTPRLNDGPLVCVHVYSSVVSLGMSGLVHAGVSGSAMHVSLIASVRCTTLLAGTTTASGADVSRSTLVDTVTGCDATLKWLTAVAVNVSV
jgi:hypothetical protein